MLSSYTNLWVTEPWRSNSEVSRGPLREGYAYDACVHNLKLALFSVKRFKKYSAFVEIVGIDGFI